MEQPETSPATELAILDRIFRFLESGLVQTVFGIVGGLSGTFLDGRYYSLLAPLVLVALHRDKVLDGLERPIPAIASGLISIVAVAGLFLVGVSVNHARQGSYTPQDYAKAVRVVLPETTKISTTQEISMPSQVSLQVPAKEPPSSPPPSPRPQANLPDTDSWGYDYRRMNDTVSKLMKYQLKNRFQEPLDIYYLEGNLDSFRFGLTVEMMFRNGGWSAKLTPRTDISYIEGIVLMQSSIELIPDGTQELEAFAKDAGIPIHKEEGDVRVLPGKYYILIGKAPQKL